MPTPTPAPEYVVLRTIVDGDHITDKPTSDRVVPTDEPIRDYQEALDLADVYRTGRYHHRETGSELVLTGAMIRECASTDPELDAWLRGAQVVETVDYAIVLERAQLGMFEPK